MSAAGRLPPTLDELQRAYERSGLRRLGVTFWQAMARPALQAALRLGVAMLRRPPRVDIKRLQAGDVEPPA